MTRIVIIVLAILITSSYLACSDSDVPQPPSSGNARFELTPDQLVEIKEKAVEGNMTAIEKLADYYNYIENDQEKAISWYKKSAEHGNTSSQEMLAILYLGRNDKENAFQWYRKLAENGNTDSQIHLAELYLDKKDMESALYWYKKAASKGNIIAEEKLKQWLTPSEIKQLSADAMNGNPDAAYKLFEYYIFIENDKKKSKLWLKKAAEKDHKEAEERLKCIEENRKGKQGAVVNAK